MRERVPRPLAPGGEESQEGEERRVDQLLGPFLSDPGLWPVTLVLLLSLGSLGALLLLGVFQSGNLFAVLALAILVLMTLDALWRDLRSRRLGRASRLVLSLWGLSGLVAGAAAWSGIY